MLTKAGLNVIRLMGQYSARFPLSTLVPYAKKINPLTERHSILALNMRSCTTVQEAIEFAEKNLEEIQAVGKTMLLDYFNEFYMDPRVMTGGKFIKMNGILARLKDLSIYEKCLKLSILQKTKIYYMYRNDLLIHNQLVQQCVQSLIEGLEKEKQDLTINDYFNVLVIFRVQVHQNLIHKCFERINEIILNINQDIQYIKIWQMLIHQFSYYDWIRLRQYPQIIKFFTNHFTWAKQNRLKDAIEFFIKITQLKLHLVGEQKIPKCIGQIIQILHPKINEIPVKSLCLLIKASSLLPAQFHREFKTDMIKRLGEINVISHAEVRYPFECLSSQFVDKFLSTKDSFPSLWYCLLYATSYQRYSKFLKGSVIDFFRKYLNSYALRIKSSNKEKVTKQSQIISRICLLAYHFYKAKDAATLSNIKIILMLHLDRLGYECFNNLSFTNFLNLLLVFHQDPIIGQNLSKQLAETIQKRRGKVVLYESNYIECCFEALEYHANTDVPIIRQHVIQMASDIIQKQKEITNYEIKLLLELIKHPTDGDKSYIQDLKKAIWKKIKNQDIEIVLEYYNLAESHNLRSLQELLEELKRRGTPLMTVLNFISSLKAWQLENIRGRLEQNLVNYLNKNKQILRQELKSNGLKQLNTMTRLLSILNNFPNVVEFNQKLYLTMINVLSKEIWEDSEESGKPFTLNGRSSRAITNFIMKFEQIFPHTKFQTLNTVLWKIYKIYCTLLKQDSGPYLKIKFLEFCLIYKQYIAIPEGIEIEHLFSVNTILQSQQNLPEFTDIMLILLKLHCLGLQKMENNKILQYSSILSMEINSGKLSIFKIVNQVKSTNLQIKLLKIQQGDLNVFKETLSPLYIKSVQLCKSIDMNLLQPFLIYSHTTNQIQALKNPVTAVLNTKISPTALDTIINHIPYIKLDPKIFRLILNKIHHVFSLADSTSITFLYFLEKAFYKTPEQFSSLYEQCWEATTKILEEKITIIKSSSLTFNESLYLLGRFSFYMFCCIKRNKTANNQVFAFLSKFVLNHPIEFLTLIRKNELLCRINKYIYLYVSAEAGILNRNKMKLDQLKLKEFSNLMPDFRYFAFSKKLEQKFKNENVKAYRYYQVEGFSVPYFCPAANEIIFVGNNHHKNLATETNKQIPFDWEGRTKQVETEEKIAVDIPFYGLMKFQVEVHRRLLGGQYKVKVYNQFTDQYLED